MRCRTAIKKANGFRVGGLRRLFNVIDVANIRHRRDICKWHGRFLAGEAVEQSCVILQSVPQDGHAGFIP